MALAWLLYAYSIMVGICLGTQTVMPQSGAYLTITRCVKGC